MEYKTQQERIEKLRELIKEIDFAMLTTIDAGGNLRSRPMSTQKAEFDGDVWFITADDTTMAGEIRRDNRVNVSYAQPNKQRYISVSGTAELLYDRAKIEEFWSPFYNVYFPNGKDDPNLRLIKIKVDKAEYWDSKGLIPTVIAFAQALAGKESELSDNEKINLS